MDKKTGANASVYLNIFFFSLQEWKNIELVCSVRQEPEVKMLKSVTM